MDSLRKRVPFKSEVEDEVEEDNRILDEQEQEEWIAELRGKAERMDKRIYRQAQAYTLISGILHIVLFFRLSLLEEPPIAFARLFALVQVLVHVNILLLLTPTLNTIAHRFAREVAHLPVPISWASGVSFLAPVVSFVSRKSWRQTGWWSVTSLIALLVWIMLRSVRESTMELDKMEKLKYDSKGA